MPVDGCNGQINMCDGISMYVLCEIYPLHAALTSAISNPRYRSNPPTYIREHPSSLMLEFSCTSGYVVRSSRVLELSSCYSIFHPTPPLPLEVVLAVYSGQHSHPTH